MTWFLSGFTAAAVVTYFFGIHLITLKLMWYWEAKEGRRMRWKDVGNLLAGTGAG